MEEQTNIPPAMPEFEMDNLPPQFEDELPSQIPPALETPMNEEQLTEAEELLSLAKGEAVKLGGFWTPTIFEEAAQSVIDSVRTEEESIRRATLVEAASNPSVSVEARTQLVRAIANDRTFDNNMIERAALTRLAEAEAAGLPSDMADEVIAQAMEEVESIPKYAVPENGAAVGWTPNALTLSGYDIGESIRRLRNNSELRTEASDVFGQLAPFKEQALVAELAAAAGINTALTDEGTAANSALTGALAVAAPGTTMRAIAKQLELASIDAGLIPDASGKLREGSDEAKMQVRQRITNVLNVLKTNSGVFADVNHATIAYMLENVFPYFTVGEYANNEFNRYIEESGRAEKELRIATLERRLSEMGPSLSEYGAQMEQEIAALKEDLRTNMSFGRALERNLGVVGVPVPDMGFNEFFSNMAAIDDIILAPDIVRVTRGGYRILKNRMVRANAVAPGVTAQNVASTLTTGQPTRITAGNDPADLLDSVLPSVETRSWVKTNVNAGVVLEEADEALALRMSDITNRVVLDDAERADALSRFTQRLGASTTARPAALQLGNSTITPKIVAGEDGLDVAGVFGKTEADAFTSAADAAKAAVSLFGTKARVRVLRYSEEGGGKLVKANASDAGGKFYFSVRTEVPYERVTDFNRWLAFGDKAITPGIVNRLWWKATGFLGFNPLGYKSSVFDRFWSIGQNAANDRERSLKRLMMERFEEATEKAGSQTYELSRLIESFEGKAVRPTRADLEEVGMKEGFAVTDELEEAFNLYRRGTDIIYTVADRYAAQQLMREGFEEVWGEAGRLGFGRRLETLKATRPMYNTATGAVEMVSPAKATELMAEGAKIMVLREEKVGGTKYVLVQGKGTVRPIAGHGVLNYIPGYIPKVISAPYVVVGVKSGERVVLGTAANSADASRLASQLEADPKLASYTISFGLDTSMRGVGDAGIVASSAVDNLGGVVFGERNASKLINGSPDILPNMRLDPLAAAIRAADAASYTLTKGDMIRQMSERMLTSINRITGETFKVLDQSVVDALRQRGMDDLADQAKAVLAQSYVSNGMADMLTAFGEGVFTSLERGFAAAYGYTNWNVFRGAATWAADRAVKGGWSPLNAAMRLSHIASVSTAFTTQMALQFAQPLLLAGLTPVSLAKAYATQSLMAMTFSARKFGLDSKRVRAISKAMGLEPEELTKLVRAMEDRGIFDAVEVDTRLRSQVQNQTLELALRRAQQRGSTVMGGAARRRVVKLQNMAKNIGEGTLRTAETAFVFSEKLNQQITFMSLYYSDKAAGVANLKSRRYLDDLSGRVREITGSMTPENSFAFQRGLFKTMFQFISFPWKMTKLVLPESLGGSRVLTGREKAGIAAAQFALYGMAGLPMGDKMMQMLNDAVLKDAPTDPEQRSKWEALYFSPEVQATLQGFFMDYTMNNAIQTILQSPETDMDISKRFAPLGGTSFAIDSFAAPFLNPNMKSMVDLFFNIPGVKATQVGEVLTDISNLAMADINNVADVDFATRWEHVLKKGAATMIAQYRREYMLAAHDAMDGHVMAGGHVSQESMTDYERWAFRLFGIDTKDRAEYFRLRDEYRDRRAGMGSEEREQEAQEYATKYYDQLLEFNRMRHEEKLPPERISMLQNEWIETQTYLASVIFQDDPDMLSRVKEKIAERVLKTLKESQDGVANPVEAQLVQEILGKMESGVLDDPRLTVNRLLNSRSLSEEQKAMVLDTWMNYVEEEGEP